MNKEKALSIVKGELTEKRYEHTLRVVEKAKELALIYNVDKEKAEIAAIFHDYAKFRNKNEMEDIIREENLNKELLEHHHELWHAPVGAFLVEKEVGIKDTEILQAIRYHTTGHATMSQLDKVIFLADYIEPGRSFPGVDEVREISKRSLDEAVIATLRNTIRFLLEKNQAVYPDTLFTYNFLINQKRRNDA